MTHNAISTHKKSAYPVSELMGLPEDDFVQTAYQTMLGRGADSTGLTHYRDALYHGDLNKIEVLGRLRYSREGRQRGTVVSGLCLPFVLHSLTHVPVLGAVWAVIFAVLRLPSWLKHQARLERDFRRQVAENKKAQRKQQDDKNTIASELAATRFENNALSTVMAQKIHSINDKVVTIEQVVYQDHQQALAQQNDAIEAVALKFGVLAENYRRFNIEQTQTIAAFNGVLITTQKRVEHLQEVYVYDSAKHQSQLKAERRQCEARLNQLQKNIFDLQSNNKNYREQIQTMGVMCHKNATQLKQSLHFMKINYLSLAQYNKDIKVIHAKMNGLDEKTMDNLLWIESWKTTWDSVSQAQRMQSTHIESIIDGVNQTIVDLSDARFTHQKLLDALVNDCQRLQTSIMSATDTHHAQQFGVDALQLLCENLAASLNMATANLDALKESQKESLLKTEARQQWVEDELLVQKSSFKQLHEALLPAPYLKDEESQAFYAQFESYFRGSRTDIRAKQENAYLALVKNKFFPKVLDLGCGRGEWLELLKYHEIEAMGVDQNRFFVQENIKRGLQVVESDIFDFLKAQANASQDIITAFHVIEHISHDQLLRLIDECYRVLRPTGIVIFETPNPENIQVGACYFYTDPTHQAPLPPEVMRFTLDIRGFKEVRIQRMHPWSSDVHLTHPDPIFLPINHLFYGPRDYAVIGYK